MPSISTLLGDSMLVNADLGNAEPLARAVAEGTLVTPEPAIDPGAVPEDQPIWSWRHAPPDVAAVTGVDAAARSMNHTTMRVLDSVRFGPVEIEDPVSGATHSLPLDPAHLTRRVFLPRGRVDGSHPMWPLPANVDASLQLVFAFEQSTADSAAFAPVASAVLDGEGFMPPAGGQDGSGPLRIAVVCELVPAMERADYTPLALLGTARIHPHVLFVANRRLGRASVTVDLQRPASTTMPDPRFTRAVHSAWFTDTNDNSGRLSTIARMVEEEVSLPLDTPLWDNVFDYYALDPPAGTTVGAVDPAAVTRDIDGAIGSITGHTGQLGFSITGHAPLSFTKLARQGAYDSVRMGPKLMARLPALFPDPVATAPHGTHDCLHLNLRWGRIWAEEGMGLLGGSRALSGWNAAGQPYSEPGAPMVPANQRVELTALSPSALRYRAHITEAEGGRWQCVLHHGGAYSVSVPTPPGTLTELITAVNAVVSRVPTTVPGPALPRRISDWTPGEWALFYAALRWQPTPSGALERIRVVDRKAALS
ncbi:hypothetical protein ABZX62_29055 [Streptomyces flavidovirens]|uniref:hypothetical protein n=1 Tax=Streptomyces flavidovirens TaxID=67298 RepID=UPI0033A21410